MSTGSLLHSLRQFAASATRPLRPGWRTLALVVLGSAAANQAHAASYTFRSDTYAWESAANAITWDHACAIKHDDDDQATVNFAGGFTFTFAGTAYSSVRVLSNGALQFGADTGFSRNPTNTTLPIGPTSKHGNCAASATTLTMLAYWDDLDPSANGGGAVTWEQKGTAPNRYLVVSWNAVYQRKTQTPYTFQVILFENGEFKYQYGNTNTTSASATIGVQVSDSDYTLYSFNSGANANGSAIRWTRASAPPAPDHYEISLARNSLECEPSSVTIKACANTSSPCTGTVTNLGGQTATLGTSAGTLAATTLTFDAAGVARTTLSYPLTGNVSAATVTLSAVQTTASNPHQCCPGGASCTVSNSCSTTFNRAGFIIAETAGGVAATLPAQTAGTTSSRYFLRAVKSNGGGGACTAALTGMTTVDWALQCNNPSTCSAGNLMTLTGNSATAINSNPNSGVTNYASLPMTFDAGGNAPFTFSYNDVGLSMLWMSASANPATLTGASNAFVTRPAGFTLSNLRQSAAPNLANPGATDAAGPGFVKAGEAFSASVTSVTSGGAATPNFGRETVPEGVQLQRTLVAPSGGALGTLANASIAGGSFSAGVATPSNLAFSEVGIITLTPGVASGNYLGAGNVSGTASANVGRFSPAQFALSAGSVTHRSGLTCSPASGFTYLGENFRLGFTLTAQNSAGVTTQNYSGGFARFDPALASGFQVAGRDGATAFSTANGRLSLASATGSWNDGIAAVALTANAGRGAAADGPFSAAFGIAPIDSDGVALAPYNMASTAGGSNDRGSVGTVALRFGRLRLANAVGSQTRSLALPLAAQYWSGSNFDTNTLDSCSVIAASAVSFGNLRRTLTTADTALTGSSFALASGLGSLTLAPPSAGRYGTVDVSLSLGSAAVDASCLQPWTPGAGDAASAGANLSFLRGAWCGSAYDQDPSARASFGLYRGSDNMLYQRENY